MVYLVVACRVLVGSIFLAALLGKIAGRSAFARFVASLADLGWLPPRLRGTVAAGTVATEATIVVLLAVPAAVRVGFGLAAVAVAALTGGVVTATRRGGRVVCRCFGAGDRLWGAGQLVRNGLLGAVALLGALAAIAVPDSPPLAPGPVLVSAGLGAVIAVLVVGWDDLTYVLGRRAEPM
jgi:hypothetical protein